MKKVAWLIVSCLMVLSLVLASCGSTAPEEEEEEVIIPEEEEEEKEEEVVPVTKGPQYGGALTVNGNTLTSPNPRQGNPGVATLTSYTYDRMGVADWTRGLAGTGEFIYTSPGSFYPFIGAVAESWEQTDPYTYIFHVRQGVYFHDKPPVNGRECTAEDIVYSIENLLAHPEVNTFVDPLRLESITALDKYTVELKVNAIDFRIPQIYSMGTGVHILPHEIEETYGLNWGTAEGVCGTGPFIMTDFVSASASTFVKNPNYWGYDELNPENQIPYIDSIKVLMISDSSTALAALRTGKLDKGAASIENAESLKETNPELKYNSYLSTTTVKVSMRQDLEDLPYSDIRVRKAMSMAIDREAILNDYLKGEGQILSYLVMEPYNPEVYTPIEELPEDVREQFEYNPEKAKQLLADAGYPDGFQTECIVGETGSGVEQLQILAAYWKVIGIDCTIKTLDFGAWITQSWAKQFPHMTFGGTGTFNPPYTMEERMSDAYFNYDSFNDPEYDAGVAALMETMDEAERNQMIKELNVRFLAGIPCIQFPGSNSYNFWWPWLKNYNGESSLGFQDEGALYSRIWIDQELKKEMGY